MLLNSSFLGLEQKKLQWLGWHMAGKAIRKEAETTAWCQLGCHDN